MLAGLASSTAPAKHASAACNRGASRRPPGVPAPAVNDNHDVASTAGAPARPSDSVPRIPGTAVPFTRTGLKNTNEGALGPCAGPWTTVLQLIVHDVTREGLRTMTRVSPVVWRGSGAARESPS